VKTVGSLHSFEITERAFYLAQFLKRDPPGACLKHHSQAQNYVVYVGIGDRMRVLNFIDAFVERDPGTYAEDKDRDDERPEIELNAVTEGVKSVGRPGSAFNAIKQEALVASVNEGMNCLAQHC
jgi:hypothetical protein